MTTSTNNTPTQRGAHPHGVTIIVDGEPVTATGRELTANQILGLVGLDPSAYYLVELHGKQQDSYEGRGDEPIKIHENSRFMTLSTGSTPTS